LAIVAGDFALIRRGPSMIWGRFGRVSSLLRALAHGYIQ
jgi:hypothetical protein